LPVLFVDSVVPAFSRVAAAAALAEENALAATLQVAAAYDELMLAHKKEVHCNIITAEVGSMLDGCATFRLHS
jgi:hypothetical protein